MNRTIRRQRRTIRRRPAAQALHNGQCLFHIWGSCDGNLLDVGLREPHDIDRVLVCEAHRPTLRALRRIEAQRLSRYLHTVFEVAA